MQDLKELNEVITAIKEEIRQGADALTTSRSVYEYQEIRNNNSGNRKTTKGRILRNHIRS